MRRVVETRLIKSSNDSHRVLWDFQSPSIVPIGHWKRDRDASFKRHVARSRTAPPTTVSIRSSFSYLVSRYVSSPIWTIESSNALEHVSCGSPEHSRLYTRAQTPVYDLSQTPNVEFSIDTVVDLYRLPSFRAIGPQLHDTDRRVLGLSLLFFERLSPLSLSLSLSRMPAPPLVASPFEERLVRDVSRTQRNS